MRNALSRLLWNHFLPAVIWSLPLCVAWWGATYVVQCVQTLTAPGVPIEYRYESEAGTMLVRADSYQFDLGEMEGAAARPRVYSPDGDEVASAKSVEFALKDGVAIIKLVDPVATVHRRTDGTFDVASMLPKETDEKPMEGAVRFAMTNAHVSYFDDTVSSEPFALVVRQAVIDTSDGSTLFRAAIEGDVTANANGSITKDGRLRADAWFDKADLAPVLPFVNALLDKDTLGEFANISADALIVDGSAQVWKNDTAKFAGKLTVDAKGLRSQQTLKNATLSASVVGDGSRVGIKGTSSQQGFASEFDATLHLDDKLRIAGNVYAKAATRQDLLPQLVGFVDPAVAFNDASFDGRIDTDFDKFFVDGSFVVASAEFAGQRATGLSGRTRIDQDRLFARIATGSWAGVDFGGAVGIDFNSGALSGGLQTERGRLEPLAEHFGTDRIKGIVSATAVFQGTVDKPVAQIYARGSGGLKVGEGPLASLGVYELRGSLDSQGVTLDRLTSTGENGVLAAKGSMAWESGAIDFEVKGGGLDLASAVEGLKGLAFVNARVLGTRDKPEANGRVEVYGLEAFDRGVPQLVADWTADSDALNFDRIAARAGTGQVNAFARMLWSDKSLSGEFGGTDLRLEDWVSKDTVGSVSVEAGKIAGTWDEPQIAASLKATKLYAGGVDIDEVVVPLTADRNGIRSDAFVLRSGSGELSGSGEFDFGSKQGGVRATFQDVALARVPFGEVGLTLDGLMAGSFEATFDNLGLQTGKFGANVDMFNVNSTPVGAGWIDATYGDGALNVEGQIGSIERYILLTAGRYDTETKQMSGEIDVYDILFQDIAEAFGKSTQAWPLELREILASTTGLAKAAVALGGSAEDPLIDVRSLTLSNLTLRGRDAGAVTAKGGRSQGVWTLEGFHWENGETTFDARGTIDETGAFDVSGGIQGLQAPWINTLFPSVPLLSGVADGTFAAKGTLEDPQGSGTFNVRDLGFFDGKKTQTLSFTDVDVSLEDRIVDILGDASFQALTGKLRGQIPFSSLYEQEGEPRQPMNLQVDLDPTAFAEFGPYMGALDGSRSKGTVEGSAWIVGLLGEFATHAELRVKGESLALTSQETAIKDLDLLGRWDNGATTLHATFASDQGGDARIDLSAMFPDVFAENFSLDDVKSGTTLNGTVSLNDFRARFMLPTAERASRAIVDSEGVTIAGTLGAPRLGGKVSFSDVFVRLPQALEENRTPVIYPIDPVFDGLQIEAAQGSRIDSGTARIDFFGTGRLNGSLQNPDIAMPLTVSGGLFEMPTARIAIESGGSINIGYRGVLGAAPVARVDLDLEGRTTLSARRLDNEYETYFVQLYIRGNLMGAEGLNITASSDPPDLSSDQIMAILGQKDLIEGFARSGSNSGLRESLYTAALPSAASNFTAAFARDLRLDYISLDYNPFDQAIAGAGKTIGKGLMLHASRQLAANPGERLKYDVQLTYRLPLEDAFFSRVRLSLGLDEAVPWRVRLNWGRRF